MTTDASITMDISVSEATGPLTWCLLLDLCSDSFSLNIGQNTFEIHTSSQFAPTIGGVPDTLKRNTDQYTITIIRNAILTFDAQGGDCDTTMQDQNDAVLIDFPASCSLALNSFAGWNTAPDGSGVTYEPGDTWPFFTVGSGTLYAQWTPVIALLASGGLLLLAALRSLFVAVAGRRSRRKYADEEWSRYNV
jgi:hypothetical protein